MAVDIMAIDPEEYHHELTREKEIIDVLRELIELEELYPKVQRIEKLMRMEKLAEIQKIPVKTRVSHKDKQFRHSWRMRLQNLYITIKEIIAEGTLSQRELLRKYLQNTEIPELQAVLLVAKINHTSTIHNIREKCQFCQIFHYGYPHRKVGEEARKSKAIPRPRYRHYERVIIEGHGVVYEPIKPPCERVVHLRIPVEDRYGKELLRAANRILRCTPDLDIAIAKIKKINEINKVGLEYPFLVIYKNVEGLEGVAKQRALIPVDPDAFCPRIKVKTHSDEIPENEEPYIPQPAPDHFVNDVLYDPDSGNIFLSPKHGSEEVAV